MRAASRGEWVPLCPPFFLSPTMWEQHAGFLGGGGGRAGGMGPGLLHSLFLAELAGYGRRGVEDLEVRVACGSSGGLTGPWVVSGPCVVPAGCFWSDPGGFWPPFWPVWGSLPLCGFARPRSAFCVCVAPFASGPSLCLSLNSKYEYSYSTGTGTLPVSVVPVYTIYQWLPVRYRCTI